MRVVARAKGLNPSTVTPERLPPRGCEEIVLAFLSLHRSRSHNGFGPLPIALTEIVSWAALNGVELNCWEVEAIQSMDAVAMEERAKQQPKGK
jgi:hypothetical protein